MRKLWCLLFALACLPLLAEDPAAEYAKRLKKIEQDEAVSHAQLAKYCEDTKMWKECLEEYSRVMELAPDSKDIEEKMKKAQERADVVVSRPTEAEKAKYLASHAAMRKAIGKKYRDLANWAKSKGLEDEADEAAGIAEDYEAVRKVSNDPRQQAIDLLNRARRKCKLKPVVLSQKLSDGAQKHADYLIRNAAHPSTKGLGGHNEDPSLPGYTEEGARAGHQSDIGSSPPPSAMAGMLGTFYHRIPLLHPDLKEVGIGYAESKGGGGGRWGGGGGGKCVIDYSGVSETKDEKAPRVVAYPADRQKGVQRAFDNEEPDPIPSGEDQEAGIAITLTWFDEPSVTDAKIEVTSGGVSLGGYESSQERPARSDFPNEHSVCFIPKDPLDANTVYKVKVTATVDGAPFTKEWEFTTGSKMAEGRGW